MNEENVLTDLVKYELMVIIRPDLATDAVNARLEEIRKLLVAKKGDEVGEIFYEDIWGMRDLSYRIKKHDRGYYAVFDFTADPSAIKELELTLNLEPEVLRHMFVKLPFTYEPKSYAVIVEEEKVVSPTDKKDERRDVRAAHAKPAAVKKEEKAAVAEDKTPAEEVAEKETAPAKEEKPKKKETTLEDVDAKLKSIIENPDINF